MQQLTEIRWHARAGQGAVTAAKVVAETALSADQYMQAMPEYGPERMGAPIKAFTRISNEPIEIHNNIENPDVVIVLDETLLDVIDVTEGMKPDGVLIRNLGALSYFQNTSLRKIGDFSLNVANPLTASVLMREKFDCLTLSYDLNGDQVLDVLQYAPAAWFELTLHQHIPMSVSYTHLTLPTKA